jgi:hypothetical protein
MARTSLLTNILNKQMTYRIRRDRLPRCSLASCTAPDVLSATLAEMGGWIRNFLPLIAETEEIHRAVRRVKVGGGGKPAATPRVVLISLSRRRLTGWRSFISLTRRPLWACAILLAAVSGPTQSS